MILLSKTTVIINYNHNLNNTFFKQGDKNKAQIRY